MSKRTYELDIVDICFELFVLKKLQKNLITEKCQVVYEHLSQMFKCSTAQIVIARKPVFQPNPKIRCLVLDNFQKKKILGK